MQAVQNKGDTRAEVLEIIREMPNLTSPEIATLMPHVNKQTVMCMINYLKKTGVVTVGGKKDRTGEGGWVRAIPTYTLSTNPTPNVVKMKRKAPTEAALHIQIRQLNEKLAELEAWKRDAISRYPDLAVDPIILKARKLVSAEVRAGGDTALADQIVMGRKDDTLMMRVTVKALEEGND